MFILEIRKSFAISRFPQTNVSYLQCFVKTYQALIKMKSEWKAIDLTFVTYKDTGVSILASIDDVQVLLDDHIVKTTTMKNSPYIKPFETQANEWDVRIVRINKCSVFMRHCICVYLL